MFYFLFMQVSQSRNDLLRIVPDFDLFERPIFREDVSQTGLALLKVDAEELVKELAAEKLDYILMIQLFVKLHYDAACSILHNSSCI